MEDDEDDEDVEGDETGNHDRMGGNEGGEGVGSGAVVDDDDGGDMASVGEQPHKTSIKGVLERAKAKTGALRAFSKHRAPSKTVQDQLLPILRPSLTGLGKRSRASVDEAPSLSSSTTTVIATETPSKVLVGATPQKEGRPRQNAFVSRAAPQSTSSTFQGDDLDLCEDSPLKAPTPQSYRVGEMRQPTFAASQQPSDDAPGIAD